jgi:ATP-dependent helicase/nuclease subunit A
MSLLPTDPQGVAADPSINAFVTANAGSGKTKTLIDRVARLLLAGARPAAILCVTYTKAAASEMQGRLFKLLGGWAVMDDAQLRAKLSTLQGRPPESFDDEALSKARALFAGALETPGGLKIQTIHAFCEALLRRFPLEAGIAPGFTVMDDAQAGAIAKAARADVALYAGAGEGLIADAYARMSVALDFEAFQSMFTAFEAQRGPLAAYFGNVGDALPQDVWDRCGFDAPSSVEAEEAKALTRLDLDFWREAATVMGGGSDADRKRAAAMAVVAADPAATFEQACAPFFTEAGGKAKWTGGPRPPAILKARPDILEGLAAQQDLLAEGRERVAAARVAEDTVMALSLAKAYVVAYRDEKKARAALDFADLIERTYALLRKREDAAWVLYKLDGGIDHLLLDEAQDTAPEQWAIIRALVEEFFAGAGADPRPRTLFVVGDEKQSIYSFQGADPARFLSETAQYRKDIRAAGFEEKLVPLTTSYRSTREVLQFVDAVFETEATHFAVPPPQDEARVAHSPFRTDGRGCVDLWPLVREAPGETREAWDAPLDEEGEASANRRLALRIAAEISALVSRGDAVFDSRLGKQGEWRPATYGDVLILVRRRGALFEDILRALKHARIPVAGADRLKLSAHIAFDDLLALARFCLFPDDDLTLAALLKSPFCGLDDDQLYALARPRGKARMWAVLNARADEQALWCEALAFLTWAREQGRVLAPFELFARALDRLDAGGRSMRQRFLTRLGAEAQDALAEFLSQAAAAEQRGVRDLESLAAAFAGLDIVVKREMDEARGEVRVMTTHGAKGLEAPIVILPEISFGGSGRAPPLLRHQHAQLGPGFLWCSSGKSDCDASAAAREARNQAEAAESLRLLYVALTRARDRLILCGRIAATAKIEALKGWHPNLSAAFAAAGVAPNLRQLAMDPPTPGEETFTRFGPDPVALGEAEARLAKQTALPAWTSTAPAIESPLWRYAQPSRVAEAEMALAPSPLAQSNGLGRYRRGEIIHRLLQLLPDVAPDQRRAAAARLLAADQLTPGQRAEMAEAALSVLEDPAFAAVFAPGSRAEAAIAGTTPDLPSGLRISGRVDRLAVSDDRVLVVDFKTNRPAPAHIGAASEANVLQMALYWSVLRRLFPGRSVEAALVWTDGPKLMPVPEELMVRALQSLAARVDR